MRASGGGRLWRLAGVAVAVLFICAVGVPAEQNPIGPQGPLAPDWASAADPVSEFAERSADVSEAVALAESADHEVTQARAEGRVSVLVYMEPTLSRHAVKRADVRQFAAHQGGKVRYEYHAVLPNVLNQGGLAVRSPLD